ncbi:putative serine--tRNA ligase DIA4 TDEL_0A04640 [Torulaspora delbrueckii]|uniref:serine--tRNA ligase n=1 Tax=Torulaspora delbrueckii TaxID=4950 RepID=G8ZMF2_TORDE|nr:hypothetical protein TDEL_0A04640 [Torulaspora delbrueckii]CCE89796.1 hypothetical protein TDEL_0A04640 [Torulaspora delbrueckii]
MISKRSFSQTALKRFLKKPQFNVKSIVNDLPQYRESIAKRQLVAGAGLLEGLQNLPEAYETIRGLNHKIALVQGQRKSLEAEIKNDRSKIEVRASEIKSLKSQYQLISKELDLAELKVTDMCSSLPNLVSPNSPATEPQIVHWINPQDSYEPDAKRDHVNIMVEKGLVDFQTASNVSGTSWFYLLNEGAELEQALVSYALKQAKEAGFQVCIPPSIVRNEVIDSCGFRPRDMNNEQQIYHINDTSLGLTATAEIALAGLGINKVMDLSKGPRSVVGVSRSYRAEAGARGKDTKGLYRVHEFTKVELFVWAKPEESTRLLEKLKDLQIDIVTSLGLSAKVLNMPANDLGAPAYKKYDIEAWMPGRGSFGEITSSSNCLDYQSRRLNTRFKNELTGKPEYVHTLNGTAMAVPRVILALIENFYCPTTGKITIPEPLRPFMNNRTCIE